MLLVVAVAVAGVTLWMVRSQSPRPQASGNVRLVTAERGTVVETVSASGNVLLDHQVTVSASRKVLEILVKPGDQVKAGQTIAKLDSSDLELQLDQAKAELEAAEASLRQAQISSAGGAAGSHNQGPEASNLVQLQNNVKKAQAQVDAIEEQIKQCSVEAPIAGTVLQTAQFGQTSATQGAEGAVTGGSPSAGSGGSSSGMIAVIGDMRKDGFLVQAQINEMDISKIKAGQKASIQVPALPGETFTGKVQTISLLASNQGGVVTYPVAIKVDDSKGKLLPGLSCSVTIETGRRDNVLTLPVEAIASQGNQVGVWMRTATGEESRTARGSYRFVPVKVGLYGDQKVEVTSGLKEGDVVAVLGTVSSTTAASNNQPGPGLFRFWTGSPNRQQLGRQGRGDTGGGM